MPDGLSRSPPSFRPFGRYVALGDSSTEGLSDPLPERAASGEIRYRGWADRLAAHLDAASPGLLYANLAVRGLKTRAILETQLEPALALAPDVATLFCGTNDVVAKHFEAEAVAADIDTMQRALREAGATLLTFTLPDLTPVLPAARRIAPRIAALNAALREHSADNGVLLVDLAEVPVAVDPRLWNEDRLHANSAGHARIAAALAEALALPGTDASWREPLPHRPPPGRIERMRSELRWTTRHLLPWALRHLVGRSSGDGRRAKRPELGPMRDPEAIEAERATVRSTG